LKNIKIGDECISFCKLHVNQVIQTLINIIFSGQIYARHLDNYITLLSDPHVAVSEADSENETFVSEFNEKDAELFQNDSVGQWATREFDFVNENWFDMAIFF
jgi:hypothetical protein